MCSCRPHFISCGSHVLCPCVLVSVPLCVLESTHEDAAVCTACVAVGRSRRLMCAMYTHRHTQRGTGRGSVCGCLDVASNCSKKTLGIHMPTGKLWIHVPRLQQQQQQVERTPGLLLLTQQDSLSLLHVSSLPKHFPLTARPSGERETSCGELCAYLSVGEEKED